MNILVTGIAGDIGLGIGRILRRAGLTQRLIGCDVHERHLAGQVFDACHVVPLARDEGFLDAMSALIRAENIDLIIPAAEPEQRFYLAHNGMREIAGVPLLMANTQAMTIGFDKLATARFLEQHGLPFPWTRLVDTEEPLTVPCIVKSRAGSGSKAVNLVANADQLNAYRTIAPGQIWQELIGEVDDEHTCGVYRSQNGEVRTIVFKRRLTSGITTFAEVVYNDEIEQLCRQVAERLDLRGSINLQLRLADRGPVIFEINPRFSSTLVFRDMLGFEDVVWSVCETLRGELPPYVKPPQAGTKLFRNWQEVIAT